jgi:hypothetical protein
VATDITTHLQRYASAMLECGASPSYMRRCVAVWKDAYGEKVARDLAAFIGRRGRGEA